MAAKVILWILLIAGIYIDSSIRERMEGMLYWPLCEFAALIVWFLMYSFIVARHVKREKQKQHEREIRQQQQLKKGGLLAALGHLRRRNNNDQIVINEPPSHEVTHAKKDGAKP